MSNLCFYPLSFQQVDLSCECYNKTMFRDLAPLYSYMRRYRWGYLCGTLSCICTNAIWVLFPQVIQRAVDEMGQGVSRQRILLLAGLLVAIAMVKGVFLYAQRWILIGHRS